jgi:hypothetical protein
MLQKANSLAIGIITRIVTPWSADQQGFDERPPPAPAANAPGPFGSVRVPLTGSRWDFCYLLDPCGGLMGWRYFQRPEGADMRFFVLAAAAPSQD